MPVKLSTLQRLKRLDDERNKLLGNAKQEAMEKVEQALSELNALGFSYRVIEGSQSRQPRKEAGSRKGTRKAKDAPCPVCGFKTKPLHDARSHRGQENKKAFTAAELNAKGLKKA